MATRRQRAEFSHMHFSNRVPRSEAALKHRVIRTPAKGGLRVVILSRDMVGHQVHYHKRSGVPCILDPCPLCMQMVKRQWDGHVWCRSLRTQEIAMLVVPPTGAVALEGIFDQFKTLRGAQIELYRVPAEKNGKVFARLLGFDDAVAVPENLAPVERFLTMMWKVPVQTVAPALNDPLGSMSRGEYDAAAKANCLPAGDRFAHANRQGVINGVSDVH